MPLNLHSVSDARERILRRLRDAGRRLPLVALVPEPQSDGEDPESASRRLSRWTSTFVAGLELAKQQWVGRNQEVQFRTMPVVMLRDLRI